MSDIELVIKIDENTYNNFICNEYSRVDVIAIHNALVNGTPLEQEPKWIPVTDRLPEEYIACLCTIRNHETFNNRLEVYDHVISYDPDSKEWLDEDMSRLDYEVIAWMPLPKPYEPQESEESNETNN